MAEIFKQNNAVSAAQRRALTGKKGAVLWFTGLSGSGKSTVACLTEKLLLESGIDAFLLDGDNLRLTLNSGLGFSNEDRSENIRRIACTAALFAQSGAVAIASAISPFTADRDNAKKLCESAGCAFIEVYVNTPLAVCEKRDTKGLYRRARDGEINDFTGISSPYEAPENPDIVIDTVKLSADEGAKICADYIKLLITLDKLTEYLCDTARWAGESIMDIYSRDFDVEFKADSSPLTQADLASNAIICRALEARFPDYSILSEESRDDLSRLENPLCFVVDPLDGTKEFVKRNGEFTVNIALTYYGKPVVGVVYAPALDKLYYAAKGFGAFMQNGWGKYFAVENRIAVSGISEGLTVMASRSHSDEALVALLERNKEKVAKTISIGSSLKGCAIAAGEAEVYYRTGPTMEWDTAAMQCVAEQAGAVFLQGDGTPMKYNRENSLNDKGFFILNKIENQFK